jgi:uncharacterized protein YukE
MRFIQILPFLGVAAATAELVERQVSVVSGVFSKISTDVTSLDSAVKSFSGDGGALTSASTSLLADIKSGTDTISNSQSLDLTGATQIATSVTGLQSTIQTTIQDLISAKSKLVAAGLGGTVYQSLVAQKTASQGLSDAVAKKTPTELQSVATQLSGGIISAIQQGIDAYADQKDAPTGGAGGASSAPASSAGPTKSAAGSSAASTPTTAVGAASTTPKASATKPAQPSQYTGAAAAQTPIVGFALAAAGIIAAL